MKKILLLYLLLWSQHVFADESVEFCLAKDYKWSTDTHLSQMKVLGVDCATLYYNLSSRYNRINALRSITNPYLDDDYKVIMVLIFSKKKQDRPDLSLVEQVLEGVFDEDLDNLVQAIKEEGKPLVIRPFHEVDASWHEWGMYNRKVNNTVEKVTMAMKHVIVKLKQAGNLVQIDLNLNRRDGRNRVMGDADYYMPILEPLIDTVSFSTYNRCGTNKQEKNKYERSFQYEFAPAYKKAVTYTKKPINVAETSTSGLCTKGDKLPWFNRAFYDLKEKFPATKTVTLYFGYKEIGEASNTVPIDWGLTPADRPRFRRMLNKYWPERYSIEEKEDDWYFDSLQWSMPWSSYVSLRNSLHQPSDPVLNPYTDKSFGTEEFVFIGQFTQMLLYHLSDKLSFGPMINVGVFDSTNDNRWWDNRMYYGLGIALHYELPRDFINWGRASVAFRAARNEYTVSEKPGYLDNDTRLMVEFSVISGGDWLH